MIHGEIVGLISLVRFLSNAGHGNKRIIKALKKVLEKPLLTYTYTSPERAEFLKYLIDNTPSQFEKAFLLSAGTEATEAALKLMRLNGEKVGKRKGGVICFRELAWSNPWSADDGMESGTEKMDWLSRPQYPPYSISLSLAKGCCRKPQGVLQKKSSKIIERKTTGC